jgi:hypothetical protein
MIQGRAACIFGLVLVLSAYSMSPLGAEENESWVPDRDQVIDNAGVAYGVTFGNFIYPGFKAATMILAAPQAGLAWLLSLGDTEQARTIWRAQTEGPYYIDREQARKALGLDADPEPYPFYDRELTE